MARHKQEMQEAGLSPEIVAYADGQQIVARSFSKMRRAALNWGYDRVAYANFIRHHDPVAESKRADAPMITYPTSWREHYVREGYQQHDVLFRMATCNSNPIHWNAVRQMKTLKLRERRVFDDGYNAGVRHGITIPFHGPNGFVATVAFASSGTVKDINMSTIRLFALAAQFHAMYSAVNSVGSLTVSPPSIGPRARECLEWAALGKSNVDIGTILEISPRTVETHIARTAARLNVRGKIPCVIAAARLGIIHPFRNA